MKDEKYSTIYSGRDPEDRYHYAVSSCRGPDDTLLTAWLKCNSDSGMETVMLSTAQGVRNFQNTESKTLMPPVVGWSEVCGGWLLYSCKQGGHWPLLAVNLEDAGLHHEPVCLDENGRHTNFQICSDSNGALHAVWERHTSRGVEIRYACCTGEGWSKPDSLTDGDSRAYDPVVAADDDDRVWVAYTAFRNGRYDVYLRAVNGAEHRVSRLPDCAYYPSLIADPERGVWIAFVAWTMPFYFTEPQGYPWRGPREEQRREFFRRHRMVYVHYHDGERLSAVYQPNMEERLRHIGAVEGSENGSRPQLIFDNANRLHLLFRTWIGTDPVKRSSLFHSQYAEGRFSLPEMVQEEITDTGPVSVIGQKENLVVMTSTDTRQSYWDDECEYYDTDGKLDVISILLPLSGNSQSRSVPPTVLWPESYCSNDQFANESADVSDELCRTAGTMKCVFGGLHRHTDLSICSRGRDGEVEFAFRLERDILGSDFTGLTDHSRNLDALHRRRYLKTAAFGNWPGYYVTIPSYEWNKSKMYGDLNLHWFIQEEDDMQVFICGRKDEPGGTSEKLIEQVRGLQVLGIPHHVADLNHCYQWQNMPTDLVSAVEIFQDVRGCALDRDVPGVTPRGHVLEAGHHVHEVLNDRGLKLGFVSGSDHCGCAVTGLWVDSLSRQGIYDAIRHRSTFASTGIKAMALLKCNGIIMGQTCPIPENGQWNFEVAIDSPEDMRSITLVRNGTDICGEALMGRHLVWKKSLTAADDDLFFYVRLEFEYGDLVWTSPIYIDGENKTQAS